MSFHDNSKNIIQNKCSCKLSHVCIEVNNMIGCHYDVKERNEKIKYNRLSNFVAPRHIKNDIL